MISGSAGRTAVMTWRDEAALAAITFVHASGESAMQILEAQLDAVALALALRDAEGAARAVVRPAMRLAVGERADLWFTTHARALRQLDARLEALALRFADIGERPLLAVYGTTVAAPWRTPAWLRGSTIKFGSTLKRAVSEVVERAMPDAIRYGAKRFSARVGHEFGARSGAYEQLRVGGRIELASAWLGISIQDMVPRSYLTQLLDVVDRTAAQAKEIIG